MVEQDRDVLAPLAQRRQVDLDRVEPEQQVLAEAPLVGQLLGRAGWSRRRPGRRSAPACWRRPGRPARCSSAVSSLGWRWSGRLPISSRNRVLWSAALSRPMRSPAAPVKAPLTWPNSSDSNRVSAVAPRSTETIGWLAAPRQAVDFARDDFLAGAVLAEDQDVGVGRRGALDQRRGPAASPPTCRAAACRPIGAELRRAAALDPRVDPAAAQRSGAAHGRGQPLVAPRLGDEIAGAALDRLDRDRHGAVGGDDHHRRVRVLLHDPRRGNRAPRGRRSPPRSKLRSSRIASGAFLLEQRQQLGRRAQASRPARTGRAAPAARRARCRDRRRRRRRGSNCGVHATCCSATVRKRTVPRDCSHPRMRLARRLQRLGA